MFSLENIIRNTKKLFIGITLVAALYLTACAPQSQPQIASPVPQTIETFDCSGYSNPTKRVKELNLMTKESQINFLKCVGLYAFDNQFPLIGRTEYQVVDEPIDQEYASAHLNILDFSGSTIIEDAGMAEAINYTSKQKSCVVKIVKDVFSNDFIIGDIYQLKDHEEKHCFIFLTDDSTIRNDLVYLSGFGTAAMRSYHEIFAYLNGSISHVGPHMTYDSNVSSINNYVYYWARLAHLLSNNGSIAPQGIDILRRYAKIDLLTASTFQTDGTYTLKWVFDDGKVMTIPSDIAVALGINPQADLAYCPGDYVITQYVPEFAHFYDQNTDSFILGDLVMPDPAFAVVKCISNLSGGQYDVSAIPDFGYSSPVFVYINGQYAITDLSKLAQYNLQLKVSP